MRAQCLPLPRMQAALPCVGLRGIDPEAVGQIRSRRTPSQVHEYPQEAAPDPALDRDFYFRIRIHCLLDFSELSHDRKRNSICFPCDEFVCFALPFAACLIPKPRFSKRQCSGLRPRSSRVRDRWFIFEMRSSLSLAALIRFSSHIEQGKHDEYPA